jgi:hypothetical protein
MTIELNIKGCLNKNHRIYNNIENLNKTNKMDK